MVVEEDTLVIHRIINERRIWNWATTLVSGELTIASIFRPELLFVGIGVKLLSTWLGDKLFLDFDKKVRNARKKLEKRLNASIDKMGNTLKKDMMNTITREFINNYVKKLFLV